MIKSKKIDSSFEEEGLWSRWKKGIYVN